MKRVFAAVAVCAVLAAGCSSLSETEATRLRSENANLRAEVERLETASAESGASPTGAANAATDADPISAQTITANEAVQDNDYLDADEQIAGLAFDSDAAASRCVSAWQGLFDSEWRSLPELESTLEDYWELIESFDDKGHFDEREWSDYVQATWLLNMAAEGLHVSVVDAYRACVERSAAAQPGGWRENAENAIFGAAIYVYNTLEIVDRARGECSSLENSGPNSLCDRVDVLSWWNTANNYTPRALEPASPNATMNQDGWVEAFPEGGLIKWPHYVNKVGVLEFWADADTRTTVVGFIERQ